MKGKKKLLLHLFLAAFSATTVAGIAACDNEPTDHGERGVYYCEQDGEKFFVTLNKDGTFTLLIDGESETGAYTYDGENFSLTFSGEENAANASLKDGVLTLEVNGGSYRFLKEVNYTVTYDVDGGSDVEADKVMNGKTLSKPSAPMKPGYNFIGWYVDAAFTTPFAFDSQPIFGDVTLYARYVEATAGQTEFTVDFDLGYEGAETLPAKKTVSGVVYDLPTPQRTDGKKFVGWWVSDYEDATKLTYEYDGRALEANTTFFAVWESETPAISVNATGVTWKNVEAGVDTTVEIFNAKGDKVKTESTSGNAVAFDFETVAAGKYTVTVTAGANSATAYYNNKALARVSTFYVADGSVLVFNPVDDAEYYLISVVCGNTDHVHTQVNNGASTYFSFTNCEMQEGGIKFTVQAGALGYAMSQSEEFTYSRDLETVSGLVFEENTGRVAWDRVPFATGYIVEITNNGNTVPFNVGNVNSISVKNYTGKTTVAVKPVAEGYNSPAATECTYESEKMVAPEVTISNRQISWTDMDVEKYVLKFGSKEIIVEDGETEYSITDADLVDGQVAYDITVQAVGETGSSYVSDVLTAQFESLQNAVSYNASVVSWKPVIGARGYVVKVNDVPVVTVDDPSVTSAMVELTKAGVNKVSVHYLNNYNRPTEDVSIEVFAYTLTLDTQGGVAVNANNAVYKAVGDIIDINRTLVSTREGYNFVDWYNVPGGTKSNGKLVGKTFQGNADAVIYAYWEAKEYTVEYVIDAEEGTVAVATDKVRYRQNFELTPAQSASSAVTFGGWSTEPNDTDGSHLVTDAEGVSTGVWNNIVPDGETFKLYPTWKQVMKMTKNADGKSYAVSKGDGINYVTSLTIPATYQGPDDVAPLPVTTIASNAFKSCSKLVEINIPDTIESIFVGEEGGYGTGSAFAGCNKLKKVNIYCPNEADGGECTHKDYEVDAGVFATLYESVEGVLLYNNVYNGKEIKFFPSKTTTGEYTIPEGVETIPINTFADATLTKVTIPASVRQIDTKAFKNSAVAELIFLAPEEGNGETLSIASKAFDTCKNLKSITLPARLADVKLDMFYGCSALEQVFIDGTGGMYASTEDGVLVDGATGLKVVYCPAGKTGEYNIPEGTTTICQDAFKGCKYLTEITIPASVTKIEKNAFNGCSGLQKVTFDGTKDDLALTIQEAAFHGCSGLTEIVLPENLTTLEQFAFGRTTKLTKVTVNTIGDVAFANNAFTDTVNGNTYVKTLVLGDYVGAIEINGVFGNAIEAVLVDNNDNYLSQDGVLYNNENGVKTKLLYYPSGKTDDFQIPDTVKEITARVFKDKLNIKNITIGANVEVIGEGAFDGCKNLRSVTFMPSTVELTIGAEAFADCSALTSANFTLPNRITTIGAEAFFNCDGLTTFVVPEGITALGTGAFWNCSSLTELSLPSTLETFGIYAVGGDDTQTENMFTLCDELTKITVHQDNEYFYAANGVLYGKDKGEAVALYFAPLKTTGEVVIPNTVDEIWAKAFKNNKGVTSITLNGTHEGDFRIGAEAFYGCEKLNTIELPEGLKVVEKNMFYNCKALTSVSVPNTVAEVKNGAFTGCLQLATVTFEEGNETTELVLEDGNSSASVFGLLPKLQKVELPERLKRVSKYAFYCCYQLTDVNIPTTVTEISDYAFTKCPITEVTFSEGLRIIGMEAFSGCDLREIDIPASVELIGYFDGEWGDPTGGSLGNNRNSFKDNVNLSEVNFKPNSQLKWIMSGTFEGCKALTYLEIPASVEFLGSYLIRESGVTKIDFETGSHLNRIQSLAFSYSALTEFAFPESTADSITLDQKLFMSCGALTKLHLSSDITDLGDALVDFNGALLTELTVASDNKTYKKVPNQNALYNATQTAVKYYYGNHEFSDELFIDNGITEIGDNLYAGQTGITKVSLPKSLKVIGASAFEGCTGITEVVFRDVTADAAFEQLGASAFKNCTSLETIHFPVGVQGTTFGASAFYKCESLKNITLPTNLVKMSGTATFQGCMELESITLPSALKFDTLSNHSTFRDCTNLKTIVNNATWTVIPNQMFNGCTALEAFTIPATVTEIGQTVFNNCPITTITIPASVTKIGSSAFKGTQITTLTIPATVDNIGGTLYTVPKTGNKLKTLTIEGNPTTISDNAFKGVTSIETVNLPLLEKTGVSMFEGCTGITSVSMPSLKQLSKYAFKGCTKLETITLPTTLGEYSGAGAFEGCTKLATINATGVTYFGHSMFKGCTKLSSVTLPDATYGEEMFSGCTGLTSVTLGNVESLPNKMFYGCNNTNFKSITIPTTVTKLGTSVFENCKNLTSIDVSHVTTYGATLFKGCTNLGTVTLNMNATALGNNMFENCTNLKSITLPTALTSIGTTTFKKSGLTSIVIPSGVTALGGKTVSATGSVFEGCTALESVTLPANLQHISSKVFYGCTKLKKIDLPATVELIGNSAFEGSGLTEVTLPVALETLGNYPFGKCMSLTEFKVAQGNPNFKAGKDGEVCTTGNQILFYPSTFKGDDGIVTIAEDYTLAPYAFYGCSGIVGVEMPETMTEIPANMFNNCTGLVYVNIPEGVTTIGASAFKGLTTLQEVVLPTTLVTINASAFDGCTNLKEFTLPESLETILGSAFNKVAVDRVVLPAGLKTLQSNAFAGATKLEEVIFRGTPTTIGSSAFNGCTSLLSVEIPEGITTVASNLFKSCTSLHTVTLPSTITKIDSNAFNGCTALKNITLPEGLLEISMCAFLSSGLEEIVIPASVIKMGSGTSYSANYGAFAKCTALTSVEFKGVVPFASMQGGEFEGCTALTEVILPEGWTQLSGYMFKGCTSLQTIELPSTLKILKNYEFTGSGLTSIVIPNGVTEVGYYVFQNCTSLVSVTLPDSVGAFGYSTFQDCTKLESITIPAGVSSFESSLFKNCKSLTTIYIPKTVTSISSSVFDGWTADQTIYFECAEVVSGSWNANWKKNCKANVVFGVTPEQYEAIVNPQPEGGEQQA